MIKKTTFKALVFIMSIINASWLSASIGSAGEDASYQLAIDSTQERIKSYLSIADSLKSDSEKFNHYTKKAFSLSKKANNKSLLGEVLLLKGKYFGDSRLIDSSLHYLNQAEEIFQSMPDSFMVAKTYVAFSSAYFRSYDSEGATKYNIKATQLFELLHEFKEVSVNLYNMALIFNRQKDYPKVLTYLKKVLALRSTNSLAPEVEANSLSYLARTYGNLYEIDSNTVLLDSTYKYAEKAYNYSVENKITSSELSSLDVLYGYFYSKRDFEKGLDLIDKTIRKSRGFSEKQLCTAYNRKSDLMLVLNRPNEAAIYADSSLEVALSMNWKSHIMYSYKAIAESNKAKGDYKKALNALEKYYELNDEILSLETTSAINELEKKYQTEKKENKIKELEQIRIYDEKEKQLQSIKIKQQNYIIIGLILTTGLIAFFLWLITKQNRLRKDRQIMETKQKLLRSQINPHFLFNGFSAVQRSIMKDENKINSVTHLSEFSRLMRHVLESSFHEFVSIENEIELLSNYLSLQRFRFDDSFDYQLNVDDNINTHNTLIPPMLLQPFLENSIEHGMGTTVRKLTINVFFKIIEDFIVIVIEDDGIGIIPENNNQGDHISRAIDIVQERLKLLRALWNKKANVEIINLADKATDRTGVKVIFHLPFKSRNT